MALKYLKEIDEFLKVSKLKPGCTGLYLVGKGDFNKLLIWMETHQHIKPNTGKTN